MKTLLLLRHAKSSWKDSDVDDHDRPLNSRGKHDAPRMGQLLKDKQLLPDFIVTSSARRCRKTAEHVIHESGYRGETRITGDLYEADAGRLGQLVAGLPDSANRVLVIGHNPGLEEFLEQLTGTYTPLTTTALVQVELPVEQWRECTAGIRGKLVQHWQPRELD
jgi:phosphohistidine phosphatase